MTKVHVFEHLGKPPYKYTGFAELVFINPCTGAAKAGGSCDHCGTAIRNAFYFTSADGKTFKVGSSCVNKSGDKGLRKFVSQETKKLKAQREQAELPLLRKQLAELIQEVQPKTSQMEHPNKHYASQGKTLHEYFAFCANGASATKARRMIRTLNRLKG